MFALPRHRPLARGHRPVAFPLAVLAASLLGAIPSAAFPTHQWSFGMGGTSGDQGRGIGVDAAGNIYVSGVFASTVDFGGGPIASNGSGDVFLAKYDATGSHLWSLNFGGTSTDEPFAMSVDADGNVAITGRFYGTANFGGATALTSSGADDVFVAVYDAGGAHVWSRRGGGTSGDQGYAVEFDPDGNVVVTGFFNTAADFGGGTLTAAGTAAGFLVKYDSAGNHIWSRAQGGTGLAVGRGLGTDVHGNVGWTGSLEGTVNLGGSNLTGAGGGDIFLAKYDEDGNHVWSQRFGNVQPCIGRDVEFDSGGNLVVTGNFSANVDFGGGILMGLIGANVFLAKYDPAGAHLWSQGFGASQASDIGYDVDLDASGFIHLTGTYGATLDFGGGAVTNGGFQDLFLARFAPDGSHDWSAGYGTTGAQEGRAIAADGTGHVVITGFFANALDFGEGFLIPVSGNDVFLARFDGGGAVDAPETGAGSGIEAQVYPNPFRATTTLDFAVTRPGRARLDVYDVTGAHVVTLLDDVLDARLHRAGWDGRDGAGRRVTAGVYLLRLRTTEGVSGRKVVRLD